MMKSLYAGVTGLKTHNQRMDVIGNNIANVNTTAYKASTVTFKDVFYQTKQSASSGDAISGGINPTQVGYGSSLGTINQVMTQSGFTYSDNVTDCAIEGEGFFQVMDKAGNIYYSRSGVFNIDNYGNLVDPNGNVVLGVSGDPTGVEASSQRINLYVPSVTNNAASYTTAIDGHNLTVSASAYGDEGNVAFVITNSKTPYATLKGSTCTVEMDLDAEYATMDDFQTAFNAALTAGGVNLGDGVTPIKFEFDSLPATTAAIAATNTMTVGTPTGGTTPVTLAFTAEKAGAEGNSIEVDLATSTAATDVSARWSGSVLTVTVPATGNVTQKQIQDAINKAADMTTSDGGTTWTGGTEEHKINVVLAGGTGTGATGYLTDAATLTGSTTKRTGLANGKDNFFADAISSLGTIKLSNGRVAADQTTQDLQSVFVDDAGVIYGVHAVHGTIAMGRIDLVTFENPTGLNQVGTSYWTESLSSGAAQVKEAGKDGAGSVVSGALEMSNVDVSQEFSDMIITQRGFQANSRIITVSDTMLEELINLKR